MKLMSWNVNGIRAVMKKMDVAKMVIDYDLDAFCLQEVKAEHDQVELDIPGYTRYWNASIVKRGYSGTAIYTRSKVLNVFYGIEIEEHDQEGRVITLELDDVYLVTVYTPNSKNELLRLDYRLEWEVAFRTYLKRLEQHKPLIICGDLNVAHNEIDLANPEQNHHSPGFSPQERRAFNQLLEEGFVDTFRHLYPESVKYSWWSYRTFARSRNIGWRIDYFLVSKVLEPRVMDSQILNEIEGSDHCPVYLEIK